MSHKIIHKKKLNPWGVNKFLLVIRGFLGTIALICIFYAIRNMPLNISTVIQYTYPIFISIFAVILIKEKISKNLIIASVIGWLGILIILNPYQLSSLNVELNNSSILIAFLGAISTSLAYITVKKLSVTEDVFIIIKYFPLISVITLSPIVFLNWVSPNFNDFIWIIGIGIFTQAGQTFLTIGIKKLKSGQETEILECI